MVTKFDRDSLNRLHDVIFDATGLNIKSDEGIVACYNKLPDHIKYDAIKFSVHDTPTRDKMSIWFEQNLTAIIENP